MFLISITKSELNGKYDNLHEKILEFNSLKISILTDQEYHRLEINADGFSINKTFFDNEISESLTSQVVKYIKKSNKLILTRKSHFGSSFFYHIKSNGNFYCSTHITLLKEAGVQIEENAEILPEFFSYRYVMPPNTLYKNIFKIMAGSKMVLEFKNGRCKIKEEILFNPFNSKKNIKSLNNIIEKISKTLKSSLKQFSEDNEKIGFLFSGGLDSSILLRICQELNFKLKKTYSTSYPFEEEKLNVEKYYATSAARSLNQEHNIIEFDKKSYLRGLIQSIYFAEEPIHHLQFVLFYLSFSEGIPISKRVIINGQGADICWGEAYHNDIKLANKTLFKIARNLPKSFTTKFLMLLSKTPLIWKKFNDLQGFFEFIYKFRFNVDNPNNFLWDFSKYGSDDWIVNYFKIEQNSIIKHRLKTIKKYNIQNYYDLISLVGLIGDTDSTVSLWSKIAESQGRIVFYPYLIKNMIELAFKIPWKVKLKQNKYVLKKFAQQLAIPDFVINRKKSGFGLNSLSWSKKGGIFDPLLPLLSKVIKLETIYELRKEINLENSMTFWNLINYGIWKRLFINNDSVQDLINELEKKI